MQLVQCWWDAVFNPTTHTRAHAALPHTHKYVRTRSTHTRARALYPTHPTPFVASVPDRCALLAFSGPVAGDELCRDPVVLNVSAVQCTARAGPVGSYPVTVSLNNQRSGDSVSLYRYCSRNRFGVPGRLCGECPKVGTPAVAPTAVLHPLLRWL